MKTRVAGLDELRGFALLGIALVNLPLLARSWESFYQPPSDNWARAGILINSGFFDGKFFTLFSFLFGAGLFYCSITILYARRCVGLPA